MSVMERVFQTLVFTSQATEHFPSVPEFELFSSQCLRCIDSTNSLDGLSLATLHGTCNGARAGMAPVY